MKATLSYKSKRNIIIASVIVVLLAAISTAGYFYIKGNDETARAFTQNEITNELTPGEQTQNNGGQQENQTQNPEQSTTPGDQNNNGGEQTPNSQTNNGQNQNNNTTNNGSTPDQTTGDVPNQEYVRERVEERTTITKEYSVEWTPETISANASVQNLNIIRPIISANKSADKNAVVSGEIITYTITVTNTGNADGKAIVKDTIPEATEFIENSIKINGENTNYTAQNLEEGITVDVAKQNEQGEAGTVKVEFKVKVSNIFAQYEKASIINQATVNEEKTNEVKNPVIKFEKLADKEKVKVGDTVTYTISIENIGDAEGTATVKDTIPTGTKLVENSTIKLNGEDTEYTEQKLNDGIELTVKSGERLELTFEVEVLSEITEAVINTAYVNDIPTETIPTQVESLIKFESNGGTSVGSMNGYTGDVIENREMPTTTREGYTFDGWYAEPELTNKVETLPEKYPAGTTTYYAKWTANTDTKYTVEYYYQNRGDYAEPTKRVERNGTTDTLAQVSNEDKIPEQTGYVYDATAENVLEGTIAGDGSLVLKVYFKQQFTVTYKPGTQGTFTKQTKTGLDYGTTTPTFEGKTTGKPGYTFAGWEPSVATEVTSNAEYVAQWTPNTDTKYTVKHYLQMLDKTQGYYLKETENNLTGTTGTLTNAQAKTYPGFTAQSFDQKEIAGDGSTVIEIYYNRNNYTYEIQYLYENKHGEYKINEGATKTGSAKPYGTIITEFPARDENGKYVLAYVEPAKSTTENKIANLVITEGDNVLKVYYKRNSFDYRIEYYKETSTGIEFIKTTKPKQRKLQTEITDEIVTADFEKGWKNAEKPNPKKVYENGIVENAESTNYYITIKESNNVIKVIYKRKDLDYTVEYYLNGTKKASYNDTAKYGDIISTLKNDNYSSNGWQKDERNSTKLPHTIEKSGDVIKIFYIKPDIKAKKTIWQDSKKLNDNAIVEAGSTVTYKITASNAGYLAGSVTIKDEELPQGKVKNITATGHTEKLTAKDLKDGIELNVPAQGTAEVTITIELTGAIGTQISNTAKYDNTKTNEVKNNVEKTLQLTTKSEIKKITNSNVILVLDISGSMKKPSNNDICTEHTTKKQHEDAGCDKVNGVWHKSRISVAKNVINNLIDNVQLPSIQTENSSVIEVIRFQFSPFVVGRATTTSDVNSLKTAVNNTNNIGGNTEMAKALNKAKAEIEELKTINNNENIVIFVSNGEPTDDKSGVIKAAEELQKLATVYTVGFDVDIDILKQIATDPEKYKTTDQAGSLSNIFKEITQEITGTPVKTVSQQGLVELTNVDTNKLNKTIVKIKGVAISNQKVIDAIVNKGKKYYIDLNKIGLTNLQDDILIEYFAK